MVTQAKPSLRDRVEALLKEYGPVAMVIYIVLFLIVWAGFALTIGMSTQPEGTRGLLGTLGAAWLAAKLTAPLRLAAAAALTPLLGRRWVRKR